jgi:alkanesulfonate monooxygenase SsuD/methylene tetrahydromethanopterin reductase-like flavin-dependent oxidoreductase (luciferase family)
MKFGVTIPNNWGIEDPQQVLELGPVAETLGYDSIWVMDHLFNNGYIRERLDDKPYYHPLATLSYLAATTKQVSLATSVLVLPYHNPVELAKYTATLDQMSGGRVILGVGVGAMTQEFEALGIPMRQRGSLTDESIAVMKELAARRRSRAGSTRPVARMPGSGTWRRRRPRGAAARSPMSARRPAPNWIAGVVLTVKGVIGGGLMGETHRG